MKKLLLTFLMIPLIGLAGIRDWDYTPFISYTDQYPGELIKEGRNFDLLLNLWEQPKSHDELIGSGFDMTDVDIPRLINQGMIYQADDVLYSA
ncbi:MAG: hypothetical protein K2K55_06295, partial [Duncaniella sp.]|nr:hypothetical protein [Duncaniella sp.]